MKISEILLEAANLLADSGIPDSRREASSLLVHTLGRDPIFLIVHPEYDVTDNKEKIFRELLNRRAKCEPFHYIVGHKEFFGLDFEVSPDVLIPRPETEILVEEAIKVLGGGDKPRFCEIGVGSGCILISILHNVKNATAVGIDISPKALAVAIRNGAIHQVDDRTRLLEGDVFDAVSERFDLIVSNPPYIPAADMPVLQREVVGFEPHNALAGGSDGLEVVRRIVLDSPEHLTRQGVLLIEIGFRQSDAVAGLLDPSIWDLPEFLVDLQCVPRVLKVRRRS